MSQLQSGQMLPLLVICLLQHAAIIPHGTIPPPGCFLTEQRLPKVLPSVESLGFMAEEVERVPGI